MRISRCPVATREILRHPQHAKLMHFFSLGVFVSFMATSEQPLPLETTTRFRCLPPMATNCCTAARRLSDLLREQQEPFLLHHLLLQDHDVDDDSATPAHAPAAAPAARRSLLRGSTAATVTKLALRLTDGVLAGCFPCASTRQRFRRLPRADHGGYVVPPADHYDGGGGAVDCGRQQLSPVSVLDLHSDDESSNVPSHRDEHSDDDGSGKPSISGTGTSRSPPSIHDDQDVAGNVPTTEERFQRKSVASAWDCEWESVMAADISRIPSLVDLDLSGSPRDNWRRLVVVGGEEEAQQVARSIEAMIFEEVRWEAVRDMLSLRQH